MSIWAYAMLRMRDKTGIQNDTKGQNIIHKDPGEATLMSAAVRMPSGILLTTASSQ
jgi:hypothetical protein